jgi:DNA-binding transcriptional LysR family regulator
MAVTQALICKSASARGAPSLDQLEVFLAVVEAGSFAAAARRLGRATSVISYQIDNLELQLGLALFVRSGTRKPQLSSAGRSLIADAFAVIEGVDRLTAKAKGLRGGLEAEISLAVDVMLPTWRLTDAAQAFKAAFPTVPLRLHVEGLGAVTQLILEGTASLGLCGALHVDAPGLERLSAGAVELIPVAAPFHPLAGRRAARPGDARGHVQLVLSDRSTLTAGQDFGVLARETWRVADLSSKHALLLAGVGWGFMPRPLVQPNLEAGRLVALDLLDGPSVDYTFSLTYRTASPPGPAGLWLIDRFRAQAEGAPAALAVVA